MRAPHRTATVGAFWTTNSDANDSNQWPSALQEINSLRQKLRNLLISHFGGDYGDPVRGQAGRATGTEEVGEILKVLFADRVGDHHGRMHGTPPIPIPMPIVPSDGGLLLHDNSLPIIGVNSDELVAWFLRMAGSFGVLQLRLTGPQDVLCQALTKRIQNHIDRREAVNVAAISKLIVDFVEVLRLSIPPGMETPELRWKAMLSLLVLFRTKMGIVEGLEADDRYVKQGSVLHSELQQVHQPLDFARNRARRADEFERVQHYTENFLTISRTLAKPVNLGGSGDCFFYSLAYVLVDRMEILRRLRPGQVPRQLPYTKLYVIPRETISRGSEHQKLVLADDIRSQIAHYMLEGFENPQARLDMRESAVVQLKWALVTDGSERDFHELEKFALVNPYASPHDIGVREDPSRYRLEPMPMPNETAEDADDRIEKLYKRYACMMRRSFLSNGDRVVYADDAIIKVAAETFKLCIIVYELKKHGGDYTEKIAHGSLSSNRWVAVLHCAWDTTNDRPYPTSATDTRGRPITPDHYVPMCFNDEAANPFAKDWTFTDKWTPGPEITENVAGVYVSTYGTASP